MTELIHAYNTLVDDELLLNVIGDERVALACEMFTLKELKMDRFHHVFPIRIRYYDDMDIDSSDYDDNNNENDDVNEKNHGGLSLEKEIKTKELLLTTELILELKTHPDNSISDVKRQLQSLYLHDWGLEGRKENRDRIVVGWEIAKIKSRCSSNDNDDYDENDDASLEVMSYHLFLHSYGISDGDLIYAIVRKDL